MVSPFLVDPPTAVVGRPGDRVSRVLTAGPRWFVARLGRAMLLFALGCAGVQAQTSPNPEEPLAEETVNLPPVKIESAADDDFDGTGMGSVEAQRRAVPFSNDLIEPVEVAVDADDSDPLRSSVAVPSPSPADTVAGGDRLQLRGFPTPTLRNGFIQIGLPETLNTGQTLVIQGPLVPVLGRAAPGGIVDVHTNRPRTRRQQRLTAVATSFDLLRATAEFNAPVVPQTVWQRVAVDAQRRTGPEEFAREETLNASAAVTWKLSPKSSALISVDTRSVEANASPGIPAYRPLGGGLIAGPYLELAHFNANGPDARVERRSTSASAQYDGQPTPWFSLRAGATAWRRDIAQDRFTTSVYSLDLRRFEGVREPRHQEQPQELVLAQVEGILRFPTRSLEHKTLVSASQTWGQFGREERALPTAVRDALPATARFFDPESPDYFAPPYEKNTYTRVIADRVERARYTSLELSDRVAIQGGRAVVTAGLRHDQVDLRVEDRRPGILHPRVHDRTGQLSWHGGINYQLRPSRLLAFGSVSTAFDPSTPVDARTGRIQDNETTLGYEAGLRGRAARGRLTYSVSSFLLYNQHIARQNPLYNDPVADAAQTQPQLVAAGEERFSGGRLELRWDASPALSAIVKSTVTRAITTASPDLPAEVGRPLTRLPPLTSSATVRWRPRDRRPTFFGGATWQYTDGFTANYPDSRRSQLDYAGYGLLHFSAGRVWYPRKREFEIEGGVRNVFDRDLLRSHAYLNAGRELSVTLRLTF